MLLKFYNKSYPIGEQAKIVALLLVFRSLSSETPKGDSEWVSNICPIDY